MIDRLTRLFEEQRLQVASAGRITKQLGRSKRYAKELSRLTRANRIPADWVTPEQRARATLKAVGK